MIPDDEIAKVLEMVRDGTITPEQGADLISAIKDAQRRPSGKPGDVPRTRTLDETIEEAVTNAVSGSLDWVNRLMGEAASHPGGIDAWARQFGAAGRADRTVQTLLRHDLPPTMGRLRLEVEVADAAVTLSAHGRSDILVRYAGPTQETPRVSLRGDRLVIEHPARLRIFGGRRTWEGPTIEVEVPQKVALSGEIELANGRLDIRRLSLEDLSAESGNGAISLASADHVRHTSVETRNGAVLVAVGEIDGLEVEALNGKVDVAGVIRSADIETTNGRIFVQPFPGSKGHVSAEASRGAILVRLPKGLGVSVDAESSLGGVRANLGDVVRRGVGLGDELHFSRGDEALKLDLETSAGSITIEEAAD